MTRRLLLLACACALGFALAACGSDDGNSVRDSACGSGSDAGAGSASASGAGSGSSSGSDCSAASKAEANAKCDPVGDATKAGTTVDVKLDEFTIQATPKSVPAGTVHFAIDNVGDEPHEMVVVKGKIADLPVADDKSMAEDNPPKGALIGEVEPFPGGEKCNGTFALDPGDYTLLCNIVEKEDNGQIEAHFNKGMRTEFTVTG